MFGSLFETDGDKLENKNSAATVRVSKQNKSNWPPEPRGLTGICGLQNQGATCYLNSLLQTLFFTPEFRGKFNIWTLAVPTAEDRRKMEKLSRKYFYTFLIWKKSIYMISWRLKWFWLKSWSCYVGELLFYLSKMFLPGQSFAHQSFHELLSR